MELLQIFRWLKVRYEGWVDHVGMLPAYDAPKKRAATKTGDLKPSSGGTPMSSRYHVRGAAKKGARATRVLQPSNAAAAAVPVGGDLVPSLLSAVCQTR